ncbi:transcriptional regulator [Streptomyces albidoflavus]|uniref:helix-turn-helix domain-containing protein n=1 Tax=Streptomyces albidoflavus TaxID=1886 RepID=UPI00101E6452|nr:helix-turn-helix transcriptional regulator [Streptomyces albidoflavus]RZE02025.1 transcriptional regulator [Streptomyces albidoflavus]RZE03089.1 transcriptional regulator [Streptomyces albidoflavus]
MTSPSSSAQAARQRVAERLRALRAEAGITGGELAARCGWTHSKSSRIENARTPPSPDDIRRWCAACDAGGQARDIVAESLNAESQYVEWRRRVRTGMRQLQDSYLSLYRSTGLFRVYSPTLVPGLLQTEGYARAVLSANARLLEAPDDAEAAALARVDRSRIIHERGHRFVFIVEEAVLRYQLGDHDGMAAQLGHLLTAGALPAVSLGVIPDARPARTLWPQEIFHVYDDTLVSIETLTARVTVTQPSEIALYLRAFEELRSMAVYGADARALIVRAIEALR